MSASNAFETSLLELTSNTPALANIGGASGLQPAATAGNLYVSLHTADPGESGDQSTSEAGYTSYARVAVARSGAGWTVSGDSASNAVAVDFPEATGGSATVTHFGIGTSASGTGVLLFKGELDASLGITTGMVPSFAIGALTVTVD